MFIRRFVRGTFVADVELVNSMPVLESFITTHKIKAVYIAPASNYELYKSVIVNTPVYPFAGGFMDNSLVLFSIKTSDDIKYFEKITDMTLSDSTHTDTI